jgi:hypothetical protein
MIHMTLNKRKNKRLQYFDKVRLCRDVILSVANVMFCMIYSVIYIIINRKS